MPKDKTRFNRVISGAKKAGKWLISEDNPVGRGSKRVSEMAEEKATQYNKQGKRVKADALRTANAIREIVTPTTPLEMSTIAGAGALSRTGKAARAAKAAKAERLNRKMLKHMDAATGKEKKLYKQLSQEYGETEGEYWDYSGDNFRQRFNKIKDRYAKPKDAAKTTKTAKKTAFERAIVEEYNKENIRGAKNIGGHVLNEKGPGAFKEKSVIIKDPNTAKGLRIKDRIIKHKADTTITNVAKSPIVRNAFAQAEYERTAARYAGKYADTPEGKKMLEMILKRKH